MKVLLIDDSTLSRTILKRMLGPEPKILEAENGMSGLELYYIEKPDIVFLDLTMPGVNGLDILNQLRKVDPQARVIVSTADIQDFSRQRASELGASAYLTKPFTQEGVQEIVRQVMNETDPSTNQTS